VQELFDFFGIWTWLIIAGVLLIVELLLSGIFFVWLGLAAICVAAVDVLADLSWQGEVALFAALSVVLVLFARPWLKKRHLDESDQPNLNRRMYDYVGKSYYLEEPIVHGRGRLRIADNLWSVAGPDLPAGAHVKVTGVNGLTLQVDKVEA
jgi:membrane protein implicated in regulation of membrane protease activity